MKKSILLSILFVVAIINSAFSQDTTYYSKEYKELKSRIGAHEYKVVEKLSDNRLIVKWYKMSGQIIRLAHKQLKRKKEIPDGIKKVWNKNGKLVAELNFLKGEQNGEQLFYRDNGIMCRKEFYKKGKLKKGECWDKKGNPIEYFPREIFPTFNEGGTQRLQKYIAKHTKYPPFSSKYRIEGRVLVSFKIDTVGNVVDVKIEKGINQELNTEALRVIKTMPKWTPGYLEGEPIEVSFTVPINFKL